MLTWLILGIYLITPPPSGKYSDSVTLIASPDSAKKSFHLFKDVEPLNVTLRFDLTRYLRTKPKKDYIAANLTFHFSKSDSISRDISLRTRGIFRNSYCKFAPIELNLKKAHFGYSDLDKISKLKLVIECRSGSENKNYVLKEYLAYKLYNVLTDTSFRVRLLAVDFIDTRTNRKPIRQYGFVIEPIEVMAARTNTSLVNVLTLTQKSIVPKVMDQVAIFNYMIGNYDWAVPGLHNIKVMKSRVLDSLQFGIAVPHDFDWSGLVNPAYAIPPEYIGIQTVRERRFDGICRTKETYQNDLKIFLKKKQDFYRIINDFPYLNKVEKKDMTDYLEEFYNQLIGYRDLAEILAENCKRF